MCSRNKTDKKISRIIGKKVFIVFVVLSCLKIGVLAEQNEDHSPKLCTSNECLRAAANLKLSMDLSIKPCEDFHKFACGKWSDEHPNIELDSSYDAYDSINDRIAVHILKLLDWQSDIKDQPLAVWKSRNFYSACTDMDARNNLGLTPMYKFLKKVKLPSIPNFLTKPQDQRAFHTFNWMKSETLIKRYFGMDVFIGAKVKVNKYNVSQNVLQVGSMSEECPLPSPGYPEEDDDEEKDEEDESSEKKSHRTIVVTKVIKYILTQVAINQTGEVPEEDVLQEAVDAIERVENSLEEIYLNYTFTDEENPPPITLEELQHQTGAPHRFWIKYFKYLFSGSRVKIHPSPDGLLVHTTKGDLEYLMLVLQYLSNTPDIELELYVWWQVVEAMVLSTSSDVVYYITKLTDDSYEDNTGSEKDCISMVKKYMGYAVTYALAEKIFPNTTKPKVGRMLSRLKTAFEHHVNELEWMDNATKRVTLEKSREMISYIGYPDWLFEKGALDKYYKGTTIKSDTHLSNLINIISNYNLKQLNSFNQTHKRSWYNDAFDESEPISANAFYSAPDNAMDIPMGILRFPMYDLGLEVLNYGALVTTLGHELTHGFDNSGRKRDKFGNFRQWWTNSTIEEFENRVECFVEQYNNFTVQGVAVNGTQTLGENVADNGGLNQAFSAYKSFQRDHGEEPKLPGFEYFSDDEMFFIAYASTWCNTESSIFMKLSIMNDSKHAPFFVRLLGSLQNSEDFSRVFNCPKGSFMNPENKCNIW